MNSGRGRPSGGDGAPAAGAFPAGGHGGRGTADGDGTIPVAVLGGSGYVAGELLRLLALHPRFRVAAAVSTSRTGEPVSGSFAHLSGTAVGDLVFESPEALVRRFSAGARFGLFAATPHGSTAGLLDLLLSAAESAGADVRAVDLSADFRFPEAPRYESIYGTSHGAPGRLPSFSCAVPEHFPDKPPLHAAQPGCFTTAVVLAAWPFVARDLVEEEIFVSAVTGSSGSGRKAGPGTHHPERRSNYYPYSPLAHRHEPEMRRLLGRARGGREPEVQFIPHSGPFVRGIFATLQMTLRAPSDRDGLLEEVREAYRGCPFVSLTEDTPRLTDVVGTNRCRIGLAARGRTLVVFSALDNLVKGAAGGAVQWMNRIFDLPDEAGLLLPGLGWF